jgi:DNA-binding NarL/FixJ family response regulator
LAAVLKHQVGFETVHRVRNLEQLLELTAKSQVDLITIADDLPGSDGVQTVGQLHSQYPDVRMAVFSHCSDVREILNLLAAGAHGVISKQRSDCAELLRALQTISEGGIFVPPIVELETPKVNGANGMTGLTERQQQVIKLLSKGHPNKVIARELGISPSTVKVHVHAAFRALGVHNRLAAVAAVAANRPMPLRVSPRR